MPSLITELNCLSDFQGHWLSCFIVYCLLVPLAQWHLPHCICDTTGRSAHFLAQLIFSQHVVLLINRVIDFLALKTNTLSVYSLVLALCVILSSYLLNI